MRHRHALAQILGDVADRVELGVPRLDAGFEMRRLGDLARAEHADAEQPLLLHVASTFAVASTRSISSGRGILAIAPARVAITAPAAEARRPIRGHPGAVDIGKVGRQQACEQRRHESVAAADGIHDLDRKAIDCDGPVRACG